MQNRELPEEKNYARIIWPLAIGALVFSTAAARAQTKWAPLAFAGIGAYAVNKAMVNQKDYISVQIGGSYSACRVFVANGVSAISQLFQLLNIFIQISKIEHGFGRTQRL